MASRTNLNTIHPRSKGGYDWGAQNRFTTSGDVTVYFGDVASAVEAFIRDSPMIVGAVAWVKSKRLIAALSERPVALVVNKEFALRVDGSHERAPLMSLRGGVPTAGFPDPPPADELLEPVRCAGHAVKGKFGALMHHKFLVRLDEQARPVVVWTGSFNLTAGAESNIENGMVIEDPAIAAAFLAEFCRVWALSEPLTFTAGSPTPGSKTMAAPRVATPRKTKRRTARKKASKDGMPKKPAAKSASKPAAKSAAKTAAKKPAAKKTPAKPARRKTT